MPVKFTTEITCDACRESIKCECKMMKGRRSTDTRIMGIWLVHLDDDDARLQITRDPMDYEIEGEYVACSLACAVAIVSDNILKVKSPLESE